MRLNLAGAITISMIGMFAVAGCKPEYPDCEKDEHCAEKGEVCVNKKCQECREDAQCVEKYGDDHECVDNRCGVKPECRSDGDCESVGDGLVCRSQKCVPECTADEDCPGGMKCEDQKCVPECASDAECDAPMQCIGGQCQQPEGATNISSECMPSGASGGDEVVSLQTIRFEFNEFSLTADARSALDQNARCIQQAGGSVTITLEGHADERGTQEYNLALGEKRANAVKSYLRNLGVDPSVVDTRSMGENRPLCRTQSESCFQQNRRVEFMQRRR